MGRIVMTKVIRISDAVYEKLNDMGKTSDSFDDVLRRLLEMNGTVNPQNKGKPLNTSGGSIPHGSILRARYKGKWYKAEVRDGTLWYKGKPYYAPTPAAQAITGTSTNGWDFWGIGINREWRPLSYYRNHEFPR
jgi:hypothetical protein